MTDSKDLFRANLKKISLSECASGSLIYIPIIVLFLQENGLSLAQVFFLQSIFALFLMIGEVPTGYISDRWGRRNTLTLSAFLRFAGILVYCLSDSMSGFILGDFLLAMGWSLNSGSIEALVYDSLLETGETSQFRKMIGKTRFSFFGAEAVSAILAGFIASTLGLRAAFWAALIPFGINLFLALTLAEPNRHKKDESHHLKAILRITKQTLRKPPERAIIFLYGIISTLGLTLFWFSQPYQQQIELPIEYYGLVHAVVVLSGAIASKYTHSMERYIDDRWFLCGAAILLIAGFITLGFVSSIFGLALLVTSRMAWAVFTPLTSDMLNRMTPSDIRATVLSLRTFSQRVLFAIVTPLCGVLVDAFTLSQAILIVGVIGVVAVAIVLLMMRPVWKQIPA